MSKLFPLLIALVLFGCDETRECRDLGRIKTANQEILDRAERRVQQGKSVTERMSRAKAKADEVMGALGVDKTEDEINAVLKERAEKLGVAFTRGTRELDPVAMGGAPGQGGNETLWKFVFAAKNLPDAQRIMKELTASPPMTRFVGLYAEPKKGDWRLEVVRMIVDRAPMKIKPTPLPERKDPSQVKSEFGFCGAGDLRSDIAAIESKIKAIEEQAEQITVDLPLAASWEGLWRRTEVIRDIELESQRIAKEVLDAANKSKVTMRAIGVERDIIIAEMVGTKKERGKIEQALPKDIVERARPSDTDTPGFVRMMIVNRTAEKRHKAEDKFRKQMEQRKSGANP